jgi:hypothetical protein
MSDTDSVMWTVAGDKKVMDSFVNTGDIVVEFNNNEREDVTQPLSWLKWVSLTMDERDDAVHMHLSTGDPRGSQFSVSLYRPKKYIDQTKCLIFDARQDDNYSPIAETRVFDNGKRR